jgi:hypothetical protein
MAKTDLRLWVGKREGNLLGLLGIRPLTLAVTSTIFPALRIDEMNADFRLVREAALNKTKKENGEYAHY